MQTQQDLFDDEVARSQYLDYVKQKALKTFDLPIDSDPVEKYVTKRIILPDLQLWSTPDTAQTREALANEIIRTLKEQLESNAITRLCSPGVELVVPPRRGKQYVMFASICY